MPPVRIHFVQSATAASRNAFSRAARWCAGRKCRLPSRVRFIIASQDATRRDKEKREVGFYFQSPEKVPTRRNIDETAERKAEEHGRPLVASPLRESRPGLSAAEAPRRLHECALIKI